MMDQSCLGREIHDGLGQGLTATARLAEGSRRKLKSAGHSERAQDAGVLDDHLQQLLDDARGLASGLAPVSLGPDGLGPSLTHLAQNVCETTGIDVSSTIDSEVHLPDTGTAVQRYRIAQEAMNNAVKHAQARHIVVSLEHEPQRLVLTVTDDGIGLEPLKETEGHLGLNIMRYRADILGGQLDIGRADGGGTRVRCRVPLSHRDSFAYEARPQYLISHFRQIRVLGAGHVTCQRTQHLARDLLAPAS